MDSVARRTRLQQRRREHLLPPLASSTWSRIEVVDCPMSESPILPPAPVSSPVDEPSWFRSLDEATRAALREADELLAETDSMFVNKNQSAKVLDDITLAAMIADINKEYDELMKESPTSFRSAIAPCDEMERTPRRRVLKTPVRHQMMTRARRAIVFDNFRVY